MQWDSDLQKHDAGRGSESRARGLESAMDNILEIARIHGIAAAQLAVGNAITGRS